MPPMNRYHVTEDVAVEFGDALLGTVLATFDAGPHEPRSEQDEAALNHLVSIGYAEITHEAPPPGRVDDAPPRSGRGSGRDEWAAFAARHDIDVDDADTRDDIVGKAVAAGLVAADDD